MTVDELIIILQKMPPDAKVIIVQTDSENTKWDGEVRDVIYNDPKHVKSEEAGTVELDNWPATNF